MTVAVAVAQEPAQLRWRPLDLLVCGNALLALFSIVQLPPIPIVPALYLAPAALLASDVPMRRAIAAATRSRPLQWLTALLALRVVLMLIFQPLAYGTFAEIGRYFAAWLGLMGATMYAMSAPSRFRRLAWTLVIGGGISALWLLLELAGFTSFVLWRRGFYADIYLGVDESLFESTLSGLAPFRHQMGYQLAAFVPLACALVVVKQAGRAAKVLSVALVVVGLLALAASLQRSALAAVLLSLLLLALTSRRIQALTWTLAAAVVAAVIISTVAFSVRPELAQVANFTLVEKIKSEEQQWDSDFRLRLQGRALELMAEYPLGLAAEGQDWNEVGFYHTYRKLRAAPSFYDRPFAVHNGYLVDAVQYGLVFFVLTLILLWSIAANVLSVFQNWRQAPASTSALVLGTATAVSGTLSLQTLTHNASLTSMEPSSVWLIALLVAAHHLCTTAPQPTLPLAKDTSDGGIS